MLNLQLNSDLDSLNWQTIRHQIECYKANGESSSPAAPDCPDLSFCLTAHCYWQRADAYMKNGS